MVGISLEDGDNTDGDGCNGEELSALVGNIVFCPDERNIPPPTLLVFASRVCFACAKEVAFGAAVGVTGGEDTDGEGVDEDVGVEVDAIAWEVD